MFWPALSFFRDSGRGSICLIRSQTRQRDRLRSPKPTLLRREKCLTESEAEDANLGKPCGGGVREDAGRAAISLSRLSLYATMGAQDFDRGVCSTAARSPREAASCNSPAFTEVLPTILTARTNSETAVENTSRILGRGALFIWRTLR
jgi:hypothetical protein